MTMTANKSVETNRRTASPVDAGWLIVSAWCGPR
jgi:hypothetical protein